MDKAALFGEVKKKLENDRFSPELPGNAGKHRAARNRVPMGDGMARNLKGFMSKAACVFLGVSILCVFNLAQAGQEVEALRILNITPGGEDVPVGRQIVFQFSRPVVPVGRMEREASEIPITITPGVKGQWRWLNAGTLVLEMDEASALSPATRYEILVRPGITAEDGGTMRAPVARGFITERPRVNDTWFKTWEGPGTPVIRLLFNQPVLRGSVEKHVFMNLPGRPAQRIEVTVRPDPDDAETPAVLPVPGEPLIFIPDRRPSGTPPSGPSAGSEEQGDGRRMWLVSPESELPSDTPVELKVAPGLVSALGPETGIEDRVAAAFNTFPAFAFEGVECTGNKNEKIFIKPEDVAGRDRRCNPLETVSLVFSSPVIVEEVKTHMTIQPDLAGGRSDYDPWAYYYRGSRLSSPYEKGRKYYVRLPGPLKAYQEYRIESNPENFRDEFGRILDASAVMTFSTDHRRPEVTLINPISVLEKKVDSDMPLVVTNLSKVTLSYDRLTATGKDDSLTREIEIPKVEDVAFRIPAEVRKMLDGKSGVVRGKVAATPAVSGRENDNLFFAQVTPFQVHVKTGHFNTLVWVTTLDTGKPVSGAGVSIYKDDYRGLSESPGILAEGTTDGSGVAMLPGIEKVDPDLKLLHYRSGNPQLFVRVDKGKEMALLPLDYEFEAGTGVASGYSVWSWMRRKYGHIHAWGMTAQGVYRAGDTVQYKLYVRDQNNETFVPAPRDGYTLTVIDPMGKTVHQVNNLTLSEFGASQGEFTAPKTGAVGWYQFTLSAPFLEHALEPMRVLVSDFTPSPFRVTTEISGQIFQPGDEMEVATRARLHAGGPYADAAARVTVTLASRRFRSEDPSARGFFFDTCLPDTPHGAGPFSDRTIRGRQGGSYHPRCCSGRGYSLRRSSGGKRGAGRPGKIHHGAHIGEVRRQGPVRGAQAHRVGSFGGGTGNRGDSCGGCGGKTDDRYPDRRYGGTRGDLCRPGKGLGNAYLTKYTRKWIPVETTSLDPGAGPSPLFLRPSPRDFTGSRPK